jgi:hypothetical protein
VDRPESLLHFAKNHVALRGTDLNGMFRQVTGGQHNKDVYSTIMPTCRYHDAAIVPFLSLLVGSQLRLDRSPRSEAVQEQACLDPSDTGGSV